MLTAITEETNVSLEQGFLDRTYLHLTNGNISQGVDLLIDTLHRVRAILEPREWNDYIENVCLKHPVMKLMHQGPLTSRAYLKPRGYAGDAQMIDYIYGVDDDRYAPEATSDIGEQIFEYCMRRPAPVAVRERRRIVANHIDALAKRINKPRILALAAGCLREADISVAVKQRKIGEFIALDQDPQSLAVVERDYSQYGVSTVCADVHSLVKQNMKLGKFDFVYATGLFDYLKRPFAKRLARTMLSMTRPGGQILIPNFAPDVPDVGYMEAFMGWKLVYRDGEDLLALFEQADLTDYDLFSGANNNIVYVIVRKPKS